MEHASSQGVFLHAETKPGASQLGAHHFVKGSGAAEKDFMEKKPQTRVLISPRRSKSSAISRSLVAYQRRLTLIRGPGAADGPVARCAAECALELAELASV